MLCRVDQDVPDALWLSNVAFGPAAQQRDYNIVSQRRRS